VRTSPWIMPLTAGTTLLALPWPVDSTPKGLGLTLENGFTAKASATTADQIQLWTADTSANATTYDSYWLLKNGTTGLWLSRSNTAVVDLGTTLPLPAHRAFFFKAQPTTAVKGWRLP